MTHHSDLELPVWLMVAYICGDPPVSAPILLGLYMLKEPPTPNTAGGPFQIPRLGTNHTPFSQKDPLLSREEKLKWLLSDSGRKTAAKVLAGVICKKRNAEGGF